MRSGAAGTGPPEAGYVQCWASTGLGAELTAQAPWTTQNKGKGERTRTY